MKYLLNNIDSIVLIVSQGSKVRIPIKPKLFQAFFSQLLHRVQRNSNRSYCLTQLASLIPKHLCLTKVAKRNPCELCCFNILYISCPRLPPTSPGTDSADASAKFEIQTAGRRPNYCELGHCWLTVGYEYVPHSEKFAFRRKLVALRATIIALAVSHLLFNEFKHGGNRAGSRTNGQGIWKDKEAENSLPYEREKNKEHRRKSHGM